MGRSRRRGRFGVGVRARAGGVPCRASRLARGRAVRGAPRRAGRRRARPRVRARARDQPRRRDRPDPRPARAVALPPRVEALGRRGRSPPGRHRRRRGRRRHARGGGARVRRRARRRLRVRPPRRVPHDPREAPGAREAGRTPRRRRAAAGRRRRRRRRRRRGAIPAGLASRRRARRVPRNAPPPPRARSHAVHRRRRASRSRALALAADERQHDDDDDEHEHEVASGWGSPRDARAGIRAFVLAALDRLAGVALERRVSADDGSDPGDASPKVRYEPSRYPRFRFSRSTLARRLCPRRRARSPPPARRDSTPSSRSSIATIHIPTATVLAYRRTRSRARRASRARGSSPASPSLRFRPRTRRRRWRASTPRWRRSRRWSTRSSRLRAGTRPARVRTLTSALDLAALGFRRAARGAESTASLDAVPAARRVVDALARLVAASPDPARAKTRDWRSVARWRARTRPRGSVSCRRCSPMRRRPRWRRWYSRARRATRRRSGASNPIFRWSLRARRKAARKSRRETRRLHSRSPLRRRWRWSRGRYAARSGCTRAMRRGRRRTTRWAPRTSSAPRSTTFDSRR